ncbi:MAG: T9SS type A sorting domain-containing protein [Bacteroidetes bacterium]|nr:T9SS type A sorting domain-containing protein [Bacteroidota bacterium]MCL1968073.1 T9SS type A sorting domain-containing protein [Bacteroidota bacterium]
MKHKILPLFVFLSIFSICAHSQSEIIEEEFMAVSSIETPSFVIHFEYNQNGKVISEIKEAFGDDYSSYKFEYKYDENGNITQQMKYHIYYTEKEENSYNANKQIIEKRLYIDYGTGLKFIGQKFYTYQDTLLETILNQVISSQGETLNSTKQELTYNKEHQLERVNNFDWVLGDWMHTEIYYFEYNDFGDILYYTSEVLQGEDFEKYWRFAFNYNDEGKLTERLYQIPLNSGWSPKPLNRYLYKYEEIKEDEAILLPNIYQFDELNSYWFQEGKKLVGHDYWLADCGGTLHFVESARYLYKPVTVITHTGIENYPKDEIAINIYPNPTTGELRITNYELRIEKIEIFDVYGRELEFNHLITSSSHHLINVSHLVAGIYFVKITTEKQTITKKLIKQ